MNKILRITIAITLGMLFSAFLYNGNISTIHLTMPAYADGSCENALGPECICNGWGPCSPGPCCAIGCACQWVQCTCQCTEDEHTDFTRPHITEEFRQLQRWLVLDWFNGHLLPGMMAMTEEFTTVAMQQAVMIGAMFDAQMENETQHLLRRAHVDAHKDYFPSEGVCVMATNVRSLAITERFTQLTNQILNNRFMTRQTGRLNDNAAEGVTTDFGQEFRDISNTLHRSGRLQQVQDDYCNPREIDSLMQFFCGNGGAGATEIARVNADMSYVDLFADAKTIDINFLKDGVTDPTGDPDNFDVFLEDYIALSKNLYGHTSYYRPEANLLKMPADFFAEDKLYDYPIGQYLRLRSLIAKRNVAINSFNSITAMKSRGSAEVAPFMGSILSELGIGNDQISEMLKGSPSYFAQMEVLTKKIYQNPQFYVELYDKPANVARKNVALKAIGLMQDWDILESKMRIELLAAILLELNLIDAQDELQDDTRG